MTRGFGEVGIVDDLPEVVAFAFGLVTQFGDVWFLCILAAGIYWFGRDDPTISRDATRTSAYAVALLLGAYGLTLVLKHSFGLPRPPGAGEAALPIWLPAVAGPVYESMVTGHGFGFPSGHALTTTVVYGGLAKILDVWDSRRRTLAAGTIVGLVALSRIVLGVHYVVDVLVGVAVGLAYLWAVNRYANSDPVRALVPPVAFGGVAYLMTRGHKPGAVAVVALGGLLVWQMYGTGESELTAEAS